MWHSPWPPTLARVSPAMPPSPAFHVNYDPCSCFQFFRSPNIFLPGRGEGINSLDGERSSGAGCPSSVLEHPKLSTHIPGGFRL